MQHAAEALATGIEFATRIVMLMTEDLKGDDWLHRPCPQANCAAWTLGHLVLTARSMITKCGGNPSDLPPLPDGFERRFGRGDDAPKCSEFGDASILRPMFEEIHKRLAALARTRTPAQLDTPLGNDHPFFRTPGSVLAFAPVHMATHAGQISTIRRSLGRPPLV